MTLEISQLGGRKVDFKRSHCHRVSSQEDWPARWKSYQVSFHDLELQISCDNSTCQFWYSKDLRDAC